MKINGKYQPDGQVNGNNIPRHRNPPPCPQPQINKIKNREMEKTKDITKKFRCINPIRIDFHNDEYIVEASEIQFKDKYFIFINEGEVKAIVPDSFLIIEVKE
ncbi:hypothetical protein KBP46_09950 [Chryseobacterium sp. PCH239]|uniref:hypothetical protein n=1 Tax=Chryseobacterium sp. PCH239 TaxID=2825845 RepID=UPI001C108639|nr:hypothetical protein [Chryseobacterium sp. PCH239]QWT88118.1 hypothetical protein KBP46_09950 [Chryseobacterium sp. PCH239]